MAGIGVMLNPTWPASFSRSVGSGKRMTFKKDEPLSLNDNEFSSVMGDIGKSLVYCKTDSDGNPINKPDWEATKADAPK
jgi:hypothetical protein